MKTCLNLPAAVHAFLAAEKRRTGASMTSTINRLVMESGEFREWKTKEEKCEPVKR
jgi:hypothetical protein